MKGAKSVAFSRLSDSRVNANISVCTGASSPQFHPDIFSCSRREFKQRCF